MDTRYSDQKKRSKKHAKIMRIFRPAKLFQGKYVETTWIFRTSKLCQKKYVETTWYPRCGNNLRSSTWGSRCINVISTLNRRRFVVLCPLRTQEYSFLEATNKKNTVQSLKFFVLPTTKWQQSKSFAKLNRNHILKANIPKLHKYQTFGLLKMHNMNKIWFANNKLVFLKKFC